jgi:hypothetical protein
VSAVDAYLVPDGLFSHAELWFLFDDNALAIVPEAWRGVRLCT